MQRPEHGQQRRAVLLPSALPWGGHNWSSGLSAGLPNSKQPGNCWESHVGHRTSPDGERLRAPGLFSWRRLRGLRSVCEGRGQKDGAVPKARTGGTGQPPARLCDAVSADVTPPAQGVESTDKYPFLQPLHEKVGAAGLLAQVGVFGLQLRLLGPLRDDGFLLLRVLKDSGGCKSFGPTGDQKDRGDRCPSAPARPRPHAARRRQPALRVLGPHRGRTEPRPRNPSVPQAPTPLPEVPPPRPHRSQ